MCALRADRNHRPDLVQSWRQQLPLDEEDPPDDQAAVVTHVGLLGSPERAPPLTNHAKWEQVELVLSDLSAKHVGPLIRKDLIL